MFFLRSQRDKPPGGAGFNALIFAALTVVACAISQAALATEGSGNCGELQNAFGPWDYTNPLHRKFVPDAGVCPLCIVEDVHFSANVENLVRGDTGSNPLEDLDYTLRAFPNHHRALYAMSRYYLKSGPNKKHGRYTIDCWFQRAKQFKEGDGVVYSIHGIFLAKKGDAGGALVQYKKALEIAPKMAEAHYNIGLLYVKLKQYELANKHAGKAYQLGYPLAGLRVQLKQLGVLE